MRIVLPRLGIQPHEVAVLCEASTQYGASIAQGRAQPVWPARAAIPE
jgi:hypothetical protein